MKPDLRHLDPVSRGWRVGLLTACILTFALALAFVFAGTPLFPAPCWSGNAGLELSVNRSAGWYQATSVAAAGPAALAGIHVGDRVDARGTTFRQRWYLRLIRNGSALPPNETITYTVRRGDHTLSAAMITKSKTPSWSALMLASPGSSAWTGFVGVIATLWALLFAILLAARRPDLVEARLLSLFLLGYFGVGVAEGSVVPSWPQVDFVITTTSWVLNVFAPAFVFTLFTAQFGLPLARTRRNLTTGSLLITSIGAAIGLSMWVRWYAFGLPDNWNNIVNPLLQSIELVALACAAAAIIASTGAERQRVVWATVTIAPVWILAAFLFPFIGQSGLMDQRAYNAALGAQNAFDLIVPVGLSYAILSRRIIDIGYVVNRTAVFAGISIIVAGIFVLVEWALGTWMGSVSHTTSTVVNIIVALALGLSIRPIHRRVEYIIDRVFFRKRHEDEAALRTFAHEAAFITDADILLDRTVEEVKQHAELDHVAVLVQNGAGTYEFARGGAAGTVSENDPAILAMRASHKAADLQRYDTAVDGDRAFPLLAKGRMLGVLVCGSKSTKEPYAPDEAEALAAVAHGVGLALDSLSRAGSDGRVVALLEQILAKLDGPPRSSS